MTNKKLINKAQKILEILIKTYPNAKTELIFDKKDNWQLLAVVILSAQTTDKKVNEISPALFAKFKNVKDFAKATPIEIEPFIKTIGLHRSKARNLVLAAQKIIRDFNGKIPQTREELESLPGVGKKTSAVVVANAFNIPAIAVDTHVMRVSQRLGLTKESNPNLIEKDLTNLWPKKLLLKAHNTLIWHGRRICIAKKPKCPICPLEKLCPKIGVTKIDLS